MFLARVDCIGCHIVPGKGAAQDHLVGQTRKASEAGCLSCHGRDYLGILAEWKASVEDLLEGLRPHYEIAHRMLHKDGSIRWFLARGTAMRDANGKPHRVVGTDTDITQRKLAEEEREILQERLEKALTKVLSGFINICAKCKKIHDKSGNWIQIEEYMRNHTEVELSHGLCPECIKDLYPDYE